MMNIVILVAFFLNAHSCRCLAHFSERLEKKRNEGHNADLENGARQEPKHEPGSDLPFTV